MRKFSRNEKILGAAVLAVLFVYLFNLLVFTPLRDKFGALEENVNRSELSLRKYLELERRRDFLLGEYKNIEKYLSLKGSSNENITAILTKIEALARKAGLTILDMKPEASAKEGEASGVYHFQLNAEGELKKMVNFIYSLEDAEILLKIDRLNLSVKDENTGVMKLESLILGVVVS